MGVSIPLWGENGCEPVEASDNTRNLPLGSANFARVESVTTPEESESVDRSGPISVLLVDDHEVILDGLSAMFKRHADRAVIVGQTRTAREAMAWLDRTSVDVVLTDIRLRAESGIDLCREVVLRHPGIPVVLFTVYDDEQYLFEGLRLGARGFLLKQASSTELIGYLERVVQGDIVIDPAIAGRVALFAAKLHSGEFWPGAHLGLTKRESEVLEQVVRGMSNKSIAARLFLGEETIKTHLSSIYRKLEVRDRTQAVAVAMREGIFH